MNGVVGPRQLQPHQRRQHAADQEEAERGDEIAPADRLVIDVREPADAARAGRPTCRSSSATLGASAARSVARHRSVSR